MKEKTKILRAVEEARFFEMLKIKERRLLRSKKIQESRLQVGYIDPSYVKFKLEIDGRFVNKIFNREKEAHSFARKFCKQLKRDSYYLVVYRSKVVFKEFFALQDGYYKCFDWEEYIDSKLSFLIEN